jgi:F-type H+-transporting ATPase subunit delta
VANDTSGIGERYAQAFFDLAKDANALDGASKGLASFQALITESADLKALVKSPVFTADEQVKAVSAVLDAAKIDGLTANFIKTVAGNRRLFAVEGIISSFNDILSAHKGEVKAEVTVAKALTAEEEKALIKALTDKLGKTPQLDVTIDASLMGGLIVKVGSKMIDTSVKTQLNSLKNAMKEVG